MDAVLFLTFNDRPTTCYLTLAASVSFVASLLIIVLEVVDSRHGVRLDGAAKLDAQPGCFSSQARHRRPSRQSTRVVLVFMPPAEHLFSPLRKGQ